MNRKKQKFKKKKTGGSLHPRNKHQGRYDLSALAVSNPDLKKYVIETKSGESINFADPQAVKELNRALLFHFYDLQYWDIPEGFLCPPIPGRVDYLHHLADVIRYYNKGEVPVGSKVKVLDVGVGANCIYPIVGSFEYQWSFIGSDINKDSYDSAQNIVDNNNRLRESIELRLQGHTKDIFNGIIKAGEQIDITICNPPFHGSKQEALESSNKKNKNIQTEGTNFSGQSSELWCFGGEKSFLTNMIQESKLFKDQVCWFSSLVSKQSNLYSLYKILEKVGANKVKTIGMGTGNKRTRIVVWTFKSKDELNQWAINRW